MQSITLVARKLGVSVARAGIAAGTIAGLNWLYNYPFVVALLLLWGPIHGSLVWVLAGLVLNYSIVLWYKNTTTDWFGLERLRMEESVEAQTWVGRLVRRLASKSRLLAFGTVSLFIDPIYGFLYHRGRVTGAKFTIGDYGWFALANILGMAPWLFGAILAVESGSSLVAYFQE